MDTNIERLSRLLTGYSCRLQPGEKVLIDYENTDCLPLVRQLVRDVYALGAKPYTQCRNHTVLREILLGADEDQLRFMNDCELYRMRGMDAFIGIRGGANNAELSDVPAEKMNLYDRLLTPAFEERISGTKWVILAYPTAGFAQQAGMSSEAFEKFFFEVCTCDYAKMSRAMDALVDLMNRTDRVRLTGPGTDLTFSVKGIPAVKCAGEMNIPDGEVFTAPVRESVNGVISYNTRSEYQGVNYDSVHFEVENGRIVRAVSSQTERINQLLDTDEGARYFGEFAIGVNPYVMEPMNNILFDEKICGSFHLTPGGAYDEADNGNRSAVHWDLVMIQRPEYGGGEIWFDDMLIRKDGMFVVDELLPLNPENLK